MNKGLGPKILALRAEGKSYLEIQKELGCSKSTISFHLGEGQKKKSFERGLRNRSDVAGVMQKKTVRFLSESEEYKVRDVGTKSASRLLSDKVGDFSRSGRARGERLFSWEDVLQREGEHPICYLTGDEIDLTQPRTYEFDHIVPRSAQGSNELSNLGIATREANRAKGNLSVEEFVALCRKVVEHYDSQA